MSVLVGDCRAVMPAYAPFDMILADPPYGDTSLIWDRRVEGRPAPARDALLPSGSLRVFGSLHSFMALDAEFRSAGLRYAQEIVWEKQNGSGFAADRFKRVRELVVQFTRDDARWAGIYNGVQTTRDATARTVRRKARPPHTGHIEQGRYTTHDGGPRLMRSVTYARNCPGRAIHPTEKPVDLIEIMLRTSCPGNGLLGDWFAGSGAVGDAARMTSPRYLGCEIDATMAARANARIAAVLPMGGASPSPQTPSLQAPSPQTPAQSSCIAGEAP